MSRKTMSFFLHVILLLLVLAMIIFFFLFLPFYGSEIVRIDPSYAWAYRPCLIWAWSFALPLFACAIPAWRVFGTIRTKGATFSHANAKAFQQIALCLCCSAFIFPIGMLILAFMGAGSAPLTFLITPLVFLSLNALGFVCYVMSRLVLESAEIREENDLTV